MTSASPASQPKTFRQRDDWLRAVNASGEPRAARCLAFAIALHLNIETGRCDPGHKTLSKEAGISERSVERFVLCSNATDGSPSSVAGAATTAAMRWLDPPVIWRIKSTIDPPVIWRTKIITRQFQRT